MKQLYLSLLSIAVLGFTSNVPAFAAAAEDKAKTKTSEASEVQSASIQSELCKQVLSTNDKKKDQEELKDTSAKVDCKQTNKFKFDQQLAEVNLEKYTGKNKWTVIEIWASDCHQCNVHMPSMVEFDGKLENVDLVGITLDGFDEEEGVANARTFVERHGITFDNILSTSTAVDIWMKENIGEGLIGTPTFIVIDPKGKVRAAQAGVISTEKLEKYILSKSS